MGGKASKEEEEANAVPGRMIADYSGPPFIWVRPPPPLTPIHHHHDAFECSIQINDNDSKVSTIAARVNDTLVRSLPPSSILCPPAQARTPGVAVSLC